MKSFYKNLKLISPKILLILLLSVSFLFRFIRLSTPSNYIFDEVYHVVTARDYAKNIKAAYNPFSPPPEKNTAYDWLHPPLAKLIQAGSIKLIGNHSLAWRLPSAIFGTLSILALYYFSLTLFRNQKLALLAAAIFSLDNLQLTMSRITMNDIFVTTFIILALTFFYKAVVEGPFLPHGKAGPFRKTRQHFFLTGLFTGLALATKWSALFLYPIYTIFVIRSVLCGCKGLTLLENLKKISIFFIYLLIVPILIYLLSFSQYFLLGYSLKDFFNLHQQIYWYQTGLTATHDYQSAAWQWPLLIRPVWIHVQYFTNKIANIYNLGNPAIFWGGILTVARFVLATWQGRTLGVKGSELPAACSEAKGSSEPSAQLSKKFLVASYFLLFIPWLFSPRILFLHHYLPALPFLCLIIASAIYKNKSLTTKYLILVAILFLFFYPINTAIPTPNNLAKFWLWFPSWK